MAEHQLVGFGFGPIQGGLFAKEAFQSDNFSRIVVVEIDAELVDAVKANKGSYYVNVAKADGIEVIKVDNVVLLNPNIEGDRQTLLEVLVEATEIATCLPSVEFYESGAENSVASLIAEGLKNSKANATIIYTAENNNHAAEILEQIVTKKVGSLSQKRVQFLNTVIGKMSRVVTDPAEIKKSKLATIAPGIERAFLVEEFNRILVSRTRIADFKTGIEVFIEKDDLLPFEEAKLFGHNAIHTLLGFIGEARGATSMSELKADEAVMQIARSAFLNECGAALVKKHARLGDELFTEAGIKRYAEDLLERITNPYLADTVARAGRDVVRKLGINGRIFGTMTLALEHGIEPNNMALAAFAGIAVLLKKAKEYNLPINLCFGDWRKLDDDSIEKIIHWLWKDQTTSCAQQLIKYVQNAKEHFKKLV
ncbi:MAG: mannitol dehydrogenase family protein [Planctomycetota bacterium]|jgi:mannitol-1-phosphate/altronate dehydrogenase